MRAPRSRMPLLGGLALSLLVAAAGVVAAWRHDDTPAAVRAADAACGTVEPTFPIGRSPVAVRAEAVAPVENPTAIAFHPTLPVAYVTTRPGQLLRLDAGVLAPEPLLDLTDDTSTEYDRGLLAVAVDPDGRWLYLYRTDASFTSRLVAWPLSGDGALADDEGVDVLTQEQPPSTHHKGGGLAFGPDGLLYLGLGDGGLKGDKEGYAQDPGSLLGKILRIDPRPGETPAYRLPPGSPFAATEGRPEVLALGLRNPFRLSFDRATSDLWIGDVGHRCVEEVDVVPLAGAAGADFGWNRMEGTRPFAGDAAEDDVAPVFTYPHVHDRACAVVGGAVYRGTAIPALRGQYVFGDFCDADLLALELAPGPTVEAAHRVAVGVPGLVGIAEDPAGELYLLSFADGVFRLVPG